MRQLVIRFRDSAMSVISEHHIVLTDEQEMSLQVPMADTLRAFTVGVTLVTVTDPVICGIPHWKTSHQHHGHRVPCTRDVGHVGPHRAEWEE